jgi:inner membrane organizing system protein 1
VLIQEMERARQLDYVQNWDAAIDITLRRLVYGSVTGAASALLLFRNPTTRWAAVAFGAGAGIGSAFTDSSELLRGLFGANFSAPKHVDAPKPNPVEAQA